MYVLVLAFAVVFAVVKAEGYYCPYDDLGANGDNNLLYDYYNGDSGVGYWTRNGETGWQTITEYCRLKGDSSVHSDAGEWKCNDSHLLCIWSGSSCLVNQDRNPDCKELCQAVLNNRGPNCLGNCPGGRASNTLYSEFCLPSLRSTNSSNEVNTPNQPDKKESHSGHHHNHHNHNHHDDDNNNYRQDKCHRHYGRRK